MNVLPITPIWGTFVDGWSSACLAHLPRVRWCFTLSGRQAVRPNTALFTAIVIQRVVITLCYQGFYIGPLETQKAQQPTQIIIGMIPVDGYLLVSRKD